MGNYTRARKLIESNVGALHRLATALLEREALDSVEIDRLIFEVSDRGAEGKASDDAGKPDDIQPADAASLGIGVK